MQQPKEARDCQMLSLFRKDATFLQMILFGNKPGGPSFLSRICISPVVRIQDFVQVVPKTQCFSVGTFVHLVFTL